jgi:hypothetical protein
MTSQILFQSLKGILANIEAKNTTLLLSNYSPPHKNTAQN